MNLYTYCYNNPIIYLNPTGNSATDFMRGLANALDDNLTGGFLNWAVNKLMKVEHNYQYDDASDYYAGRVVGDVLSMVGGIGSLISGIKTILASVAGGGAISVASGGTLAIGGVTITVSGAAAGSAEITYGGAVISSSADNFKNDLNRLIEANNNQGGLNTGSWNKGGYASAEKSLIEHYKKHGDEVGANSVEQYLRKAEAFAQNLKGANKAYNIPGATAGVTRYYKNGKYIDMVGNQIISFGKQ